MNAGWHWALELPIMGPGTWCPAHLMTTVWFISESNIILTIV
jgi:hypothetical protein